MATLQADPKVAGLNAYCTRAFANDFLIEKRLFALAGWDACTNKDAAIMWATREMDRLNYAGARATTTQRHEHPRTGLEGVDSDEIATEMQEATAELAFWLSEVDRSKPSDQEKYQELKAGPLTLKFRESPTGRELTSEMPSSVRAIVRRFLGGAATSGVNRQAVRA